MYRLIDHQLEAALVPVSTASAATATTSITTIVVPLTVVVLLAENFIY